MKSRSRFSLSCLLLPAFGLLLAPTAALRAENLIKDPGLEAGAPVWTDPYIPSGSEDKGCSFSVVRDHPHSGAACGRMEAADFARFAISPLVRPDVEPGRYRITVWVRAGDGFEIDPGTPGFTIRVDPIVPDGVEVKNRIIIDWKGEVLQQIHRDGIEPPPQKWTKVEANFTMPGEAGKVRIGLWFERARGQLFFDDLQLEKLD